MIKTVELPPIEAKEDVPNGAGPNPGDMEDIRLTLNGDGVAYARLVERYQAEISGRMWRFTREMIKHRELVQDVFVEAYLSLKTFRGKAPFGHWLARIGTRAGYRHWRKEARERSNQMVPIEDGDQPVWMEPESLGPEKAAEILHSLLEQLPPRDRLALMLRYVENRSVEETAELTGWTRTMVKVQAWRARNKLKKLFEAAGLEVER
jgi:RNA polymerase sigma-70 factor, ECF subfamily